jgi:hypothetical protein
VKTITVQIGNSDDKLSQKQWSLFVQHIDKVIQEYATDVHFSGASVGWAPWQNACYVFTCADYMIDGLKQNLSLTARRFSQESVAYTEGETYFI